MRILLKSPPTWDAVGDVLIEKFPFVIGRSGKLDCTLPLVFVSRTHCRILLRDGEVLVEDQGSSNGTFVNGRRVNDATALRHGDQLSLGPLTFEVLRQGIPAQVPGRPSLAGANNETSTLMMPPNQSPVPSPAAPAAVKRG